MHLKRMCTLQMLDAVFHLCQVKPSSWTVLFTFSTSLLIFWSACYILQLWLERYIKIFHYGYKFVYLHLSIFVLFSLRLLLDIYKFRTVIFSGATNKPFMIMKCPLSWIILFAFKIHFINRVTPALLCLLSMYFNIYIRIYLFHCSSFLSVSSSFFLESFSSA